MSTVQVPKLNTKDLLTLEELTKEEIISLIEFAIYLKRISKSLCCKAKY